jgi:phage conserved hypothetical protein, phiE125 gp8 family
MGWVAILIPSLKIYKMAWKVTTAPAIEVWTLNEVKNYLKVDTSADDTLITTLLQSAREVAERYLNQALITQTITEKLDRLSNPTIYLSISPVITVSSFQFNDGQNSVQTFNAANYVVDNFLKPARLALAYNSTWPTLFGNINDVTIVYTAGYGATVASVPMQIRQAILMMIADSYDNREDYVKKLPTASEYLLDQYRVKLF